MAPPILSLRNVTLSFGGKPLFSNIEMHIEKGFRYCLIGRNGCGKSTLLKLIYGLYENDNGEVYKEPGLKIHYLEQDPVFPENISALDFIMQDSDIQKYEAESLLQQLQMTDVTDLKILSGGERRRIALAKALSGSIDLLLLDEPTNHLDLPAIEWLEEHLCRFQGAIIVISHDRKFLSNVTNRTLWLDQGTLRYHDKGYFDYDRWQEEVLIEETKRMERIETKLRQEEDWLLHGVTARRKRNQRRLGDLHKLRELKSQRESMRRKQMSLEGVEAESSSKMIIKAQHISKKYGDRNIINDFNIQIEQGERIGIIGPNGSGKTTLLRMLLGIEKPDTGNVRLGKTIELIYFDQMREGLNPEKTMWQNMSDGDYIMVQDKPRHVVGYLKDFLFNEKQVRGPVGLLSGGEKNRLALAKCLAQKSNVMVLDEPTNDLDMDTLDLLIEILSDYQGTLIIVSHDRDFIDRITTSVWVLDGQGNIEEFIGGYSDIIKARKSPLKNSQKKEDKREPETKIVTKTKPSYKEQFQFNQLNKDIERLEKEIKEIEAKLSEGDLYQKDPKLFDELSIRLVEHKEELGYKEEEWLNLSPLFE